MLKDVADLFWTDSFWLPYGFTWDDIKDCPISNLYIAPVVAVVILIVRYVFERYVAVNFCTYIGIVGPSCNDDTKCNASDGETSENIANGNRHTFRKNEYQRQQQQQQQQQQQLQQKQQQQHQFRENRHQQQIQQFQKATETCWRCFAYFLLWVYGSYVVFSSDWFWDHENWLVGYIVNQPFTDELKWYYILELSFYMALLATQFQDTKRKDLIQQFVHHIVTIILLTGSYLIAHFRYGAVIMLCHDTADWWLEAAKLAKYAKKRRTCDVLFVIFSMLFYLTRWVYFPFWICFPWWKDNARLAGPLESTVTFPYLCLYLCFLLIGLHIYWGFLLARVIYKFTRTSVLKDERSDEDSE